MTRLQHSLGGFLRYMQMSQTTLFAFTEGTRSDRYFYARLCSRVSNETGLSYQVITASELEGTGGGKNVLLGYFEYLKNGNGLISTFKGKSTGVIFFLDKDIDDVLRLQIRNRHLGAIIWEARRDRL